VVYCGVSSPYPIPTHPVECDDSSGGGRNFNASRSYIMRERYNDIIDAGVVATGQCDNVVARYGKY
jgi:hypothetical protein